MIFLFIFILDKHIVQKAFQMTDKFLRLIKAHDIIIDRSIIASLFTQLLYLIWIRKKSDIKNKVYIHRYAMLKAKGYEGNREDRLAVE